MKRRDCEVDGDIVHGCDRLIEACMPGHPTKKSRGLWCWSLTDINTGKESRRFFGVKSGDFTDKGIVLNFCPFCGTRIDGPVLEDEEKA